jgi:prepilin-type N-terminal cleavage/methylation domain-containing protein
MLPTTIECVWELGRFVRARQFIPRYEGPCRNWRHISAPSAVTKQNKKLSFRERCLSEEPAFSWAFAEPPLDISPKPSLQRGFTLLELMVATAIFLVICAAMFSLLQLSQQRYTSESQLSGSFGEARLGIDQIIRDINIAGYPSPSMFSNPASSAAYAISPFAWEPGYIPNIPVNWNTICQIGTCTSPGPFDLIIETTIGTSPAGTPPPPVSWIHYQLQGQTLYRTVAQKVAGADPANSTPFTSGTPLVENVVNNAAGALATQITAQHPTMFESGPVPVFQFSCATPNGSQLCSSPAAAGYNQPQNISDIDVTLIVKTPQGDIQTQSLQLMELTGRGHLASPTN